MKKYWLTLAAVSVAAIAWAQTPAAVKPMGSPHLAAEVVSTDMMAKTITVKAPGQAGASATAVLAVSPKAASALKGLQPGDRVSLTCEAKGRSADPAGAAASFAGDCASVTGIAKS